MTPLDKLKALAAAKKAAQAQEVKEDAQEANSEELSKEQEALGSTEQPIQSKGCERAEATEGTNQAGVTSNETATVESVVHTTIEEPASPGETEEPQVGISEGELPDSETSEGVDRSSESDSKPDHPLVMQLAELEAALTENLPEFRTILRDIHSKLRSDPDCVTALSEDEIGAIVHGLIRHAEIEIVAPAKLKAVKKASKTPVSASDL